MMVHELGERSVRSLGPFAESVFGFLLNGLFVFVVPPVSFP